MALQLKQGRSRGAGAGGQGALAPTTSLLAHACVPLRIRSVKADCAPGGFHFFTFVDPAVAAEKRRH